MKTPRIRAFLDAMTGEKKARFTTMGMCFLKAAEAKHLKWNGSTWTKARHLLGVLCLEERRKWFASELLSLLGHSVEPSLETLDDIDVELRAKLRVVHADGSLGSELQQWGLIGPKFIAELRLLATAPRGPSSPYPCLPLVFVLVFSLSSPCLRLVLTHLILSDRILQFR